MRIQLDARHEITSEHPASHYGAGVLLVDGQPFGPAEAYPESLPELGRLLGVPPLSCAGAVVALLRGRRALKPEQMALIQRWLSQHPAPNVLEQI